MRLPSSPTAETPGILGDHAPNACWWEDTPNFTDNRSTNKNFSSRGTMSTDTKMQSMDAAFFDEYTSHDAILKYTRATAGYGISHLLDHDYRDVYDQALDLLPAFPKGRGIRVLEFGCGAGMNLVHFTSILKGKGIPLERAVGTDFSPVLIDAAKREAQAYLTGDDQRKVEFHVAKNETLVQDLADAAGLERSRLSGSFDFILGVNTIRYCHRGGREVDCARDIMELLTPGSICVVIDMNDRFPAFRSALKNRFRTVNEEQPYLPSLAEMRALVRKGRLRDIAQGPFLLDPAFGRQAAVLTHAGPVADSQRDRSNARNAVTGRRSSANGTDLAEGCVGVTPLASVLFAPSEQSDAGKILRLLKFFGLSGTRLELADFLAAASEGNAALVNLLCSAGALLSVMDALERTADGGRSGARTSIPSLSVRRMMPVRLRDLPPA